MAEEAERESAQTVEQPAELLKIQPALVGLRGPKLLILVGSGTVHKVNVESALTVKVDGQKIGLAGLRIPAISLTLKKTFWRRYDVHIQIPIALVRAYSPEALVIESDGLQEIEITSEWVTYFASPSPIGWLMLLEQQRMLVELTKDANALSALAVLAEEFDDLIRRAVRISIGGAVIDELRAVPSPVRVSERDLQEYIKKRLMELGGEPK